MAPSLVCRPGFRSLAASRRRPAGKRCTLCRMSRLRQRNGFTSALSATLCFARPQGFSIGEPQTKDLAPDLRQDYGLFAAKIWFKSHQDPRDARYTRRLFSPLERMVREILSYTDRNDLTSRAIVARRFHGAGLRRWALGARALGLLIGAACCFPAASPQPSESAPARIFGLYGAGGRSRNAVAGDSIRVTRGRNGRVGVAIKLYYDNGHTCTLNKPGAWDNDHVLVTADGLNQNEPCRLEAYFPKGGILLKDEGQRCAQVYCGTRGKLDAVSLVKLLDK
jgi:hypothetical protein